MNDVETTVDPPEVDQHGDDGDYPDMGVNINVFGVVGEAITANVRMDEGDDSAEAVADALLTGLRGVAAMLGADVQVALAYRGVR